MAARYTLIELALRVFSDNDVIEFPISANTGLWFLDFVFATEIVSINA